MENRPLIAILFSMGTLCLSMVSAHADGPNILQNGNFSSDGSSGSGVSGFIGTTDGWTIGGTGVVTPVNFYDMEIDGHDDPLTPQGTAQAFALLTTNHTEGTLSQVVKTNPGDIYDITFQIASPVTVPSSISINFGSETVFSETNIPQDSWETYTVKGTATSTSTLFNIDFQDDQLGFALGNISVADENPNPVPEISTFAVSGVMMLCAGLLFMFRSKQLQF